VILRSARQSEESDSPSVTAKKHFEVATRSESLRPALGLSRKDEAIVELADFIEDLVAKHEVPERSHELRRRSLEHPDDDAIVRSNSSTAAVDRIRDPYLLAGLTSAPTWSSAMPGMPSIGEASRVKPRLICAVAMAALAD
jgi:hypothetical protein